VHLDLDGGFFSREGEDGNTNPDDVDARGRVGSIVERVHHQKSASCQIEQLVEGRIALGFSG